MRDINVDTKLLAIIGTDVGHSKSPAMMNAAFEKLNLNYYFFPMNVPEMHFADVIQGVSKMNFAGLTITIPYKIEIIKYLDSIDPLAKIIGAVNAVQIRDGEKRGYNTDGEGFVRGLELDKNIVVKENVFFIVGSGGVSRAITTVLASRNPKKIFLSNRTFDKAKKLCDHINTNVHDCCEPIHLNVEIKNSIKLSSVFINTTNIGMPPYQDKSPIDTSYLHKDLLVADVIYNPTKTKLLLSAENLGCDIVNGQSLLLHQGKIAFNLWTGLEVPAEAMSKAIFG